MSTNKSLKKPGRRKKQNRLRDQRGSLSLRKLPLRVSPKIRMKQNIGGTNLGGRKYTSNLNRKLYIISIMTITARKLSKRAILSTKLIRNQASMGRAKGLGTRNLQKILSILS